MGRDDDSNVGKDDAEQPGSSAGGRFVRRLIPTVAAASLSFTGCLPPGNGNNGGGDGGGVRDTGGQDAGGDVVDNIASTNGDGVLSTLEIQNLCDAWSECSPDYFQQSYNSVSECVQQLQESLDYYTTYYEEYGMECVEAWEAFTECQIGNAACVNGELYFGYSQSCYTDYDYSDVCQL